MECPNCGNEIRPGQRRVPTPEGPVHESCAGGGRTAGTPDTRRPEGYETVFRALALLATVAFVAYASARLAGWAVRRLTR